MKQWFTYDINELHEKSKNIVKILKLPLTRDILVNKEIILKLRSNKNNWISKVPEEEKDRALGFILKLPSLMTRRYTGYVKACENLICPNCGQRTNHIVLH